MQRNIERALVGKVVLAERANQLYRDSGYLDLITFEEDIARIAAVVLVIAESVGSFAELGAFATNGTIRDALLIFGQSEYSGAESFIRFGPMERVRRFDSSRLAFYPWRVRSDGSLIKLSISGHFSRIKQLINNQLGRVPGEQLYRNGIGGLSSFAQLLWIMHLCSALPLTELHEFVRDAFDASLDLKEVKNRLYCMKLAGWADFYTYESKDYWYGLSAQDPFEYKFLAGVADKDSLRRKADVVAAAKSMLRIPRHVLTHIAAVKGSIS